MLFKKKSVQQEMQSSVAATFTNEQIIQEKIR